jgi:hypothetical protein
MKSFIVLYLLFFNLACIAQKSGIQLYAYEQKVIPGIAPAHEEAEARNKVQYYIYITTPQTKTVYPVSLWIKGIQFGIKIKEAATPVESLTLNDSAMVLVPGTGQRAYRLFPVETIPAKGPGQTALAKQNDVVLVYKMNGKYHFLAKKKLVQLSAVNRP